MFEANMVKKCISRSGLYPASSCIKLSGQSGTNHRKQNNRRTAYILDSGLNITYRGCSLDSGSLTADTELARVSHCGYFVLDDE